MQEFVTQNSTYAGSKKKDSKPSYKITSWQTQHKNSQSHTSNISLSQMY